MSERNNRNSFTFVNQRPYERTIQKVSERLWGVSSSLVSSQIYENRNHKYQYKSFSGWGDGIESTVSIEPLFHSELPI